MIMIMLAYLKDENGRLASGGFIARTEAGNESNLGFCEPLLFGY
jgi:hypothetical protein